MVMICRDVVVDQRCGPFGTALRGMAHGGSVAASVSLRYRCCEACCHVGPLRAHTQASMRHIEPSLSVHRREDMMYHLIGVFEKKQELGGSYPQTKTATVTLWDTLRFVLRPRNHRLAGSVLLVPLAVITRRDNRHAYL
jgi:hypothetical protein